MQQRTKAITNSFEKTPISGEIVSYMLTRSTDGKLGTESVKLEVDTPTGIKRAFFGLSTKVWDINTAGEWVAPWYTEYNRLKTAANNAGIDFIEDIELIKDPQPKSPKIQVVDVMTEPDLVGYFIKLGVEKSHSKTSDKDFTNYTVEYLSSVPEGEEPKEFKEASTPQPRVVVSKPTPIQKPVEKSTISIPAKVGEEFEKYLEFVTDLVSPGAMALRAIVNNRDSYDDFSDETRAFITDNVAIVIDDFLAKGKLIADGSKYRLVN